MTEDQIRQAILASPPFAEHVDALMAGGQPSLRLHAEKVALDDLAPGASRLGGLPDLPPGTPWPYGGYDEDWPMEMVAQINLAEVASFSNLPDLPASGWLVFLYWDTGLTAFMKKLPENWNPWQVLYFDGDADNLVRLVERPALPRGFVGRLLFGPPKPGPYYQPCTIRFEREFRLIPYEERPELGHIWKESRTFFNGEDPFGDMLELLYGPDEPLHRLRGHDDPVQDPARFEVENVARIMGFSGGTAEMPEGSKSDWELLLQIDGKDHGKDRGPGFDWGDCARVYFLIRRQDLALCDFSKVCCVFQCM